MRLISRWSLAAALILALGPVFVSAGPTTPDTKDKTVSPAEKIKTQLDETITLAIADQSLNAALKQIREKTKINIVVDRLTIQQMGIDPEQLLVSVNLKDVKVRTCLRSVLSPHNLGFAILGDTVLISTDEVVMERQMKQRVSIDLDKVDLATALKQLSKETATNLVLDKRVTAKDAKTAVTLQMENVPLDTAVKIIAEMAGLKPVKVSNVYMVTTKNIANEMRNDPELNGTNNNPAVNTAAQEMKQLQMMQNVNVQIWQNALPFQAININGIPLNGPQGNNVPIPPLEKTPEKGAEPGDDEKPPQPDKKPEPVKPVPK